MASIRIPTPLRQYTNHQAEVTITGGTVGEGLRSLLDQYPELAPHLYEGSELRGFVNVFLGDEDIRFLQELETPLAADARLRIVPAIAGGTA